MDAKKFGLMVHNLIQGKDLSRRETKNMFVDVLRNLQFPLQQGGFLAALTAKGETYEEIAGAWEAIYEVDTVKVSPAIDTPLVENCGTGMDELKTFNISTAAALIAAANGVPLARHGARAITSQCGTVDILEVLGINVECNAATVKQSIENRNGNRVVQITWQTAYAADDPIEHYEILRNGQPVGQVPHKPQTTKEPFVFEDTVQEGESLDYRVVTVDSAGKKAVSDPPAEMSA